MDSVAEVGGPLHLRGLFKRLGPGFITGAADDDPSGIATYSQAGALAGVGLLWTVVLTWPMMVAVQSVCARIGRVTGHGLAGNMVQIFPRPVVYVLVGLLLAANTINIGADLAAMGAAAELVGVVFAVHIDWRAVAVGALLPRFALNGETITLIVAIFGTTISPYLFFWQSSQEVEEEEADPEAGPLLEHPEQASRELGRIGWETLLGMAFSNLIAFFIILTTAVTLNANGQTDIQTSAQAAAALRPIAGDLAFALFSLGIIGTGLLAVPVLAGSAAYAVGETGGWTTGLERAPREAWRFYAVIGIAILLGVCVDLSPLDPIKALIWSAVLNGVITVPMMVATMIVASHRAHMGEFAATLGQRILGWLTTAMMTIASIGMFLSM
jgi:Mn2+/Fe2+ NRAMP family transporter